MSGGVYIVLRMVMSGSAYMVVVIVGSDMVIVVGGA